MLLFRLGAQRYAIGVLEVAEILSLPVLQPLAQAPPWLAGLFRYHGRWLPLIDLKQLSTGTPCARVLSSRVILVGDAESDGLLGLLAEGVTETRMLEAGQALSALACAGGVDWLAPQVFEDEEGLLQRVHWQALLTPELRALLAAEP